MIPPPPPPRPRPKQQPEQHWSKVLLGCGYPADVVLLDFECFFSEDYGLKTHSIPAYVADKKFEELALARLHVDAHNPYIEPEKNSMVEVGEHEIAGYIAYLQGRFGENLERCTCIFHNAAFDAMILAMKYDIYPPFTIDTQDLARSHHTRSKHSLKDLAEKFKLPAKGETKDFLGMTFRHGRYVMPKGRGKHRKPPVPRPLATDDQVKQLCEYAGRDVELTFKLLEVLLPKLSNPKVELEIAHDTLEMWTKPVLEVDTALGNNLMNRMALKMVEITAGLGVTAEQVSGNISFDALLTEALEAAGDQPMRYHKIMKSGMQYGLAKDDPELKALKAHPSDRVRGLVEARSALKSWPLHISRVESILAIAAARGGKMGVPLRYHGGHTGRDSGSQDVNLQNLPKRGEPEVVAIRGLLVAPPDHKLVIVDLAAIEARVLPFLADEEKLVTAFTNGADVYCQFGTTFYGVPVRKPRKDDIPAIASLMTRRRGFAKICILGMGYGMGTDHFAEYAGCDEATAEEAVKVYRETYPAITKFWKDIERAFIFTAKYKQPAALKHGVKFHSTEDIDVVMTLPNGRRMNYHRVKLEKGNYDQDTASVWNEVKHSHDHLWGGVLTENLVQAVSRDVMMEAGLRLKALGYRTVHRVHDELILCVPQDQAEACLKTAVAEMSRSPVWAPGLPLGAEGVISERYGLH